MAVEYFEIVPGAPLVFRCNRLNANLSSKACIANFTTCFNLACRGCPIGDKQAHGEKTGAINRFQAPALVCTRCERQGGRLIAGGLCVPCINRQAEAIKQRNAKGTYPSKVANALFECNGLLKGHFTRTISERVQRQSQCAPRLTRFADGAFVAGTFTGRPEFERWLARCHPSTTVVDFEQGQSLAELAGYPAPLHLMGVRNFAEAHCKRESSTLGSLLVVT